MILMYVMLFCHLFFVIYSFLTFFLVTKMELAISESFYNINQCLNLISPYYLHLRKSMIDSYFSLS